MDVAPWSRPPVSVPDSKEEDVSVALGPVSDSRTVGS